MTNTPLSGYLAQESDDELRVDVCGGTWIVRRADLEYIRDWENAPALTDLGKPVQMAIKPGAKISLLTTLTVQPLEQPMTLSEYGSKPVDSETFTEMSEEWGRSYGFALDERVARAGGHSSVCCWDEGDHGVCKVDDCKLV